MTADPVAIARDLIRCPSVTPDRGRRARYLAGGAGAGGLCRPPRDLRRARDSTVENLYARIGDRAAPSDVRRPHRRGAAGRRGGLDASAVRRRDRRRRALRPRRRRHEGRHRLLRSPRRSTISTPTAASRKGSLSFLITGDEEGVAVNGTVKLLEWAAARGETFDHCILGEPTNPEALGDMIKIGRRGSLTGTLIVTAARATSPIRISPTTRSAAWPRSSPRCSGPLDAAPRISSRRTSNSPRSMSATGPPTSSRARRARASTSASTTGTARRAQDADRAPRAGRGRRPRALCLRVAALECRCVPHQARPLHRACSAAVAEVTGRTPKLSTTGGTSDARFIKDYARWSSSASSGRPCTRSTNARRSPTRDADGDLPAHHRALFA